MYNADTDTAYVGEESGSDSEPVDLILKWNSGPNRYEQLVARGSLPFKSGYYNVKLTGGSNDLETIMHITMIDGASSYGIASAYTSNGTLKITIVCVTLLVNSQGCVIAFAMKN